ncbi:LAME_0H15214g1_1 [Lachancea meyersii CBS 8951]|uniref:peptidylprolyl isomerase n=1 Tax=Lachancea meyersii CBS 8951 TaxID=1266667 RepID=A0A1G4KI16_9SACH|nr:LAME_0H15214g1_1 [Lachancea meyersii CBS 8951]
MLFQYLLWAVFAAIGLVNAASTPNEKTYEPNPPVTHRVFFTIEYTDKDTNEVNDLDLTIELYGTVVPKTVDNFAKLSKGVTAVMKGKDEVNDRFTLGFKDTLFHRIVPDFIVQGGDVLPTVGPFNIHGGAYFADENFVLNHDRPGRLSMANLDKPDSNASQFFIVTSMDPPTHLDGKHVVFGQVVGGLDELMNKVQYVEVDNNHRPVHDVKLKYSFMEELKITTSEELHKQWLNKVQKYQNGDLSQGVTMAATKAIGQKEEAIMKEEIYQQLHHPAVKVALGMSVLLILYLIVRTRSRKSSKIVSMRHD